MASPHWQTYVEGIWDYEDVSEFLYRALTARLNCRSTWYPQCNPILADSLPVNQQTRSKAAHDVSSHYDLGPPEIMLDPTMAYTCAFREEGVANSDEAQLAKYELCRRKLEISSGMALLTPAAVGVAFLSMRLKAIRSAPLLRVTLA